VPAGRTVTGWKSAAVDVRNAGAESFDREMMEDRNVVSGRDPAALPAYLEVSLRKLN